MVTTKMILKDAIKYNCNDITASSKNEIWIKGWCGIGQDAISGFNKLIVRSLNGIWQAISVLMQFGYYLTIIKDLSNIFALY